MARRIGELLVERGVVDSAAAEAAAAGPGRLASKLLASGRATEAELVANLAEQKGLPGVDLSRSVLSLASFALVPRQVALDHQVIAVHADDARIILAMASPDDSQVIDELRFVSGRDVIPHVALSGPLRSALDRGYAALAAGQAFLPGSAVERAAAGVAHFEIVLPAVELVGEIEVVAGLAEDEDEPLFGAVDELAPAPAQAEAEVRAAKRALVVDDEEDICRLLSKALTSRGFEVETATRGLEALQKVKSFRPHILLLDAMLPEVHGFEICRKVKASKNFGNVPILMVSAIYRGWRFAQDVKETYGADAYMEKPFRLDELLRKVDELVAGQPAGTEREAGASDERYRAGVELFKEGRYAEARLEFEAGVKDDPFSPRLHAAAARAAQELGDDYGAIAAYERAVELKPDLFDALKVLGSLYTRRGFRRKASEVWERALGLAPDEPTRAQIRDRLIGLL